MQRGKLIANGITSLFILVCTIGAASWTSFSNDSIKGSSTDSISYVDEDKQEYVASNLLDEDDNHVLVFEGNEEATEIDNDILDVRISKSTKTPTSQSYTANFSSQVTYYVGTSTNQYVYIALDEPEDLTDLEQNEDEENIPIYTGYVYRLTAPTSGDSSTNINRNIPYLVKYGTRAYISVESIGSNVVDSSLFYTNDAGEADCRYTSIYIPSTITRIDEEAFGALQGYGMTFRLGFDNASQVEFDLDVFPTDATIEYVGYGKEDTSYSLTAPKTEAREVNFVVGSEVDYGDEYLDNLQLGIQYDIYLNDVYEKTVCQYFPVSGVGQDTVGDSVGQSYLTLYFDIELDENEIIDPESLIFFNIYYASNDNDGRGFYPDLHYQLTETDENNETVVVGEVGQLYAIPHLTYKVDDHIDNYINYSFYGLNTFSGYTSLRMNVKKSDVNIYEELMTSTYNTHEANIENGTYTIRYRFTNLSYGYYRITYLNDNNELVTTTMRIDTNVSSTSINTKRETQMTFLVKNKDVGEDFSVSRVRKVELVGMRITLDLYNKSRNSVLSKSSMETRFGIITLMDLTDTAPGYTNYNFVLLYVVLGYIVLFLGCAFGYYFYRKNKYKNDEFRRVNTRKFTRTAAVAFVLIGIIVMAITFIILRAVPLKNAVVTYNPTDIYVFFFALFAIIAIGYYIRYFWLAGKARRHRKQAEKLKLNEDEEDDGTDVQ